MSEVKKAQFLPEEPRRVFIPPSEGELERAMKADEGKAAFELLPPRALEYVAQAFGYGAKKYAPWNYMKGLRWGRLLGAACRHLFAWARGERLDPESGLPHLAHAACCVLMLLESELVGVGEDDRQKA